MKRMLSAFISFRSTIQNDLSLLASHSELNHVSSTLENTNFIPSMILTSSDTVATVSTGKTFEAVAPDATTVIGFGVVIVLSIIASFVWANDVVPVSRKKLALSKRDGDVKEYLEDLKQASYNVIEEGADAGEGLELDSDPNRKNVEIRPNVGDGRDMERWLFSDWLNTNNNTGGRRKEPALPILKKAKWNSGDNPVVVTALIMMVGIVIASITERVL